MKKPASYMYSFTIKKYNHEKAYYNIILCGGFKYRICPIGPPSYPDNNGYNKNNERDNRNNENDYGYTNNREDRHKNDDMRRNQNYYPQYGNQNRNDDYSYRNYRRIPLLQIILGIGSRH
jgi:hypothetical protein